MSSKPTIKPLPDGPHFVLNLDNLRNVHGPLETDQKMALCRCGGSKNKPFCDGTHKTVGFSSDKKDDRVPDKQEDYEGKRITIHDNRGICAHAGKCTDGLPQVFKLGQEPWIEAEAADAQEIASTVDQCPSGALSYTKDGALHRDREGDPQVFVAPHGPYVVTGGPVLEDTTMAQGASPEHYTLCRCGESKNKPFCDGTHWHIKFQDDKNA